MPAPPYALRKIGLQRIHRHRAMTGGWTNRVWWVDTLDGQSFIVKQMLGRWSLDNEVAAWRCLMRLGEPVSKLYAAGATVAVFEDDGARPPAFLSEKLVREVGWRLRRLHDGTRLDGPPAFENRCLLHRITRRAGAHAADGIAWCMTHGDIGRDNLVAGGAETELRMIDFEEFHPGDPLADLVVAAVELASDAPGQACAVIEGLVRGYADSAPECSTYDRWRQEEVRLSMANTAMDEAIAWARWNWKTDLIKRYADSRRQIIEAIRSVGR